MKHIAAVSLLFVLLLSGCGSEQAPIGAITDSTNQTTTVEDLIKQAEQEKNPQTTPTPTPPPAVSKEPIPPGFGSYDAVDIDLTTMSSTMVYTQVYDMVCHPETYFGQTVKLHGEFGYYYEPTMDINYFGIVVKDATACCAQGIEFVLKDEAQRSFPADYPEAGMSATVVGIFQSYTPPDDPEMDYYHLEEAEFITD